MLTALKRWFSRNKTITNKARKEMINVHSQKYIEAILNEIQYREKLEALEKDWGLLVPSVQERVEAFLDRRIANPEGAMLPESEIAYAVNVRMGIDTAKQNWKTASEAIRFYEGVVSQIKQL